MGRGLIGFSFLRSDDTFPPVDPIDWADRRHRAVAVAFWVSVVVGAQCCEIRRMGGDLTGRVASTDCRSLGEASF